MKRKTRTPKRRSARKKNLGRYASSIEKYCADQLKEYGLAFDYEEEFDAFVDFNVLLATYVRGLEFVIRHELNC